MSPIVNVVKDASHSIAASSDYQRLTFVISAPRGGALTFCRNTERLGHIGLPHTHLPLRGKPQLLKSLQSPLDLYSIDDGLLRALSCVVYGGLEPYQLEAAYHDIGTMYARETFSDTYGRFLAKTTSRIFDPSFSLSLYPDEVLKLQDSFPSSQFIYIFRDPFFYASSILSTIHGLDSLLVWWSIARQSDPDIAMDPLVMWCCINEKLLECKAQLSKETIVSVLNHPESVGRYSFERLLHFMRSDYSSLVPTLAGPSSSRFYKDHAKWRLSMSRTLSSLLPVSSLDYSSPIRGRSSWWLDITLGGDPSASISHCSNPGSLVPEYWEQLVENSELIDRCDHLCHALSFAPISSRLATH